MSTPVTILHGDFGRVCLVNMNSALALHVHHHCHFIFKAGGEDTLFEVQGRQYPLSEETAILVNAWQPHQWTPQNPARETLFLTFYIEPDWLAGILGTSSAYDQHARTNNPCVKLSLQSQSMLNSLINVMQNMWRDGDCSATGLINNIAAHIIEQHWNAPAANARQNTVFDYRIRFALEQLNTIEEPHHLNRLAREVGLSRSHFFKLFRECTGFSPLMFVNAHRMETAIAGITRSDASLIDLAFDLGFSTHGNFTRFFRQQIGVTPSNFQRAAVGV